MLGLQELQPVSLGCSQHHCALLLEVPEAGVKQYQAQDMQSRSLNFGPCRDYHQSSQDRPYAGAQYA